MIVSLTSTRCGGGHEVYIKFSQEDLNELKITRTKLDSRFSYKMGATLAKNLMWLVCKMYLGLIKGKIK